MAQGDQNITPSGQNATSGQIFVDQQRNQMLAAILKTLMDGLPSITPGQYPGTTTNNNADAGNIGEYISSTVLAGAAVSLTTGTDANVTSISLTAGDWDVWGLVATTVAGGTTTSLAQGWISTTSATLPTIPNEGAFAYDARAIAAGGNLVMPVGMKRISLAATTTVYLSMRLTFAASTASGYGFIGARRAR